MNDGRRGSPGSRLQKMMMGIYRRITHGQVALLTLAIFAALPSLFAQTPITNGYRDFNYGSTVFEAPTADKPQSKLWWNDGIWWGVLWNPSVNKYRIYRFNLAAQSWIDAGPDADDRSQSLADALWDGQKLYIASHVYSGGSQTSGNASAANSARLYRYSYNAVTDAYSLDAGFPVLINSAICEALVIDKDSNGRLWATWTQSSKVYLNRSLNNDLSWGTPFALPTQGSNLSSDDISTLVAYNGKIGVAWSNQSDNRIYFSFHQDNKADTDWEPREIALANSSLGAVADDHLNMKMTQDGGGNLYLTSKTSLSGSSNPGIYLHRRSFSGGWTNYVVATQAEDYTRPVVVIDEENRELYVIGKNGSNIYMKKAGLDNISFPSGAGDPFIRSSSADINDATVSKHNVNGTTGLLVLASDEENRYYYHNYIALPSNGPAMISSFSPAQGPSGTLVTIAGANFSGVSSVKFNGVAAANFIISSSSQITATVPAGATTGLISVTKTNGTVFSANVFTVPVPQHTLTVNISGSGSVNPSGGTYDAGAVVSLTATPAAGYQFAGWSGDLTGTANPAMITINANKNVTATFTILPPIQYALTVNTIGSGSVALNPPGGTYDAGTVVTLTPQSGAGYQFGGWSGNLSGSDNPAAITMDGNKNVTATFTEIPASSPIVYEETQTGGSSSSTTVATAANLTGVSGHLYLAAISTQPRRSVVAVSGLGLNWTLVKEQCSGLNTIAVEVWMAQGTPSGNSAVTATLSSAPSAAVIAVSRYSGVAATNPIGNVISGNTNGVPQSGTSAVCSGGVPSASYAFNLITTVNDAVVYSAVAMKGRTHAPGAGYTERAEIRETGGGLTSSIAVEDMMVAAAGSVTVDGSFSGTADWAEVGLGLRPQGVEPMQHALTVNAMGSGNVTIDPPGGTYAAGTVVTLTAAPEAGFQFSGWSGDLSGSANPATIAMYGNKNVTATFAEIPASSPIVYEETQTGGSANSTTVTTASNLTGVNGNLYLAAISTQPRRSVVGVSGLGLNWTLVKEQCSGMNTIAMEVWMAQGIPSGNGSVTATLASAPSAAVIAVSRYSGVALGNPLGNVISGNTNGVPQSGTSAVCSGGVPSGSYAFNLTTTVNDAVVYSAVAMKGRTHAPGAGYTERIEVRETGGGLTSSIAVEDMTVAAAGSVTIDGSFSGTADWAEVGLALKPQTGGLAQYTLIVNTNGAGSVTLDPPGGFYESGTVVTLTATPNSGYQFSGWSGDLSGSANPATITMDGNKNVTAAFTALSGSGAVVHEETQTGGASSSTTVATAANLTGVSGHLYLAAIASKSNTVVNNVSGLGLTWTRVRAQCAGRDQTGVEVWMAHGAPNGNGLVTATLAEAPSNAVIAVSRYSGVDVVNPLGNIVSGNTNGVNGACSGGGDNDSYAFNLTTTINGAVIYGAAAMRSHVHTPGAGYTERAEIMQGGKASVVVQDKSVASAANVTVNGSFDDAVDWAVVAVEIKPQLGAAKSAASELLTADSPHATSYQLEQNYPNPFNPSTSIRYSLPQTGAVRLTIYNTYGQTISVPVNGLQNAGTYVIDWQAADAQGHPLPSGVYFYRLEAGSYVVTRKMTLLR